MFQLFAFCALLLSVHSQSAGNTQQQSLRPNGKSCNINNYNSFYAGPNKKIESLLVDMKRQLDELQKQVALLTKDNKTNSNGGYTIYIKSILTLWLGTSLIQCVLYYYFVLYLNIMLIVLSVRASYSRC